MREKNRMNLDIYLHDRNTEVGVDECCGAPCLDRAELWGEKHIL